MNYTETCNACGKAFDDLHVETLLQARATALRKYEEANTAYIEAQDAYYKIYRHLWTNYHSIPENRIKEA